MSYPCYTPTPTNTNEKYVILPVSSVPQHILGSQNQMVTVCMTPEAFAKFLQTNNDMVVQQYPYMAEPSQQSFASPTFKGEYHPDNRSMSSMSCVYPSVATQTMASDNTDVSSNNDTLKFLSEDKSDDTASYAKAVTQNLDDSVESSNDGFIVPKRRRRLSKPESCNVAAVLINDYVANITMDDYVKHAFECLLALSKKYKINPLAMFDAIKLNLAYVKLCKYVGINNGCYNNVMCTYAHSQEQCSEFKSDEVIEYMKTIRNDAQICEAITNAKNQYDTCYELKY